MTDRNEALAAAKARAVELRAAKAPAPGETLATQTQAPESTRPAQTERRKGPSAGRILAAAGATAAGVVLVGVMAAGAQPAPAAAPVQEVRTVVVHVPVVETGSPTEARTIQVVQQKREPAPVQQQPARQPVAETEGS
ncbi:MAG: hypothetical protein ACI8Y4_000930 [Candidatus Poriferisodalaceae bacterium]|jgi:hypothetical protein